MGKLLKEITKGKKVFQKNELNTLDKLFRTDKKEFAKRTEKIWLKE